MTGIIEGIEHEAEKLFPPKPGGLVDTWRKAQAALADTATEHVADNDGPVKYQAIRTRPEPPDLGTARTITLSAANPVLMLLGQDAQRRGAVVLAVDNDVYLSSDQGLAWQSQGGASAEGCFYLLKGVPVPVDAQAPLWAACTTTAASTRISVLITRDSTP